MPPESTASRTFPPLLECDAGVTSPSQACDWVAERRDELIARSRREGALLFRGFPLRNAADFDAFVAAFGCPDFSYDDSFSNAVRVNLTPRVFTANEAPPSATIGLHHELAQTPVHPCRIFFFCERAADRGGATSLCRSDLLFERLARELPGFARACEERGVQYTHVMPPEDDPQSALGRSWRGTLGVATRAEAEARLASLSYHSWWLPDGSLRARTPVLPAVLAAGPGRKTFFNQLIATLAWKDARNDPGEAVRFGDGAPIDLETRERVAALAEEISVDVPWRSGDVALVDNFLTMHGRRSFEGTRRVLAAFAAPETEGAPGRTAL